MAAKSSPVKLAASFEKSLEAVRMHLLDVAAPQDFDALLDELTGTVIPNLERFPCMGGSLGNRPMRSIETTTGIDRLKRKLRANAKDCEPREYRLPHYLLLYARLDATVYLLSIRHHRQLSFDFQSLWPVLP